MDSVFNNAEKTLVISIGKEEYDAIRVLLSQYQKASLSLTEISAIRKLDGTLKDNFKKFHPNPTANYRGFPL